MFKRTIKLFSLFFIILSSLSANAKNSQSSKNKKCNIFIHGYTKSGEGYFGDLPKQVVWDSSKSIQKSSPEVATKILEQMDSCEKDSLIVLRPHSYGAAQVLYILGQGKRFQKYFPDHDFVKIYKNVHEVYSYTGAYHGTPIMDIVCSNKFTKFIGAYFGKSCVQTLTTSSISDVSSFVHSPGVPTYLIYSSDRSGYFGTLGTIISKHMISLRQFIFKRKRNQNDNTLPIYSTRACAEIIPMLDENSNCKKLDSEYFIDFYHEENYHHTEFLLDKKFMLMENSGDKDE
jgi:hypothetical protein